MKKYEELVDLILTKHPEWKEYTCRALQDISKYSFDASRKALNHITKSEKQSNQSKKNGSSQAHSKKKQTPKGGGPRPSPRFSDLNDTELSRHRVRQVLLDADDHRIILDAAKTLMSHQEKTGELNLIKQEKESENISQFLSRPISELAQLAGGKYLPTEPSPSLEKEESF